MGIPSAPKPTFMYDGDLHLCGSESELLDNEGKVRYAWRNLDTDGEFCSLFRHRKGDYYSLVGMKLDNYRIRNDVQFIYLLAILQAYDPSYDFTKMEYLKRLLMM